MEPAPEMEPASEPEPEPASEPELEPEPEREPEPEPERFWPRALQLHYPHAATVRALRASRHLPAGFGLHYAATAGELLEERRRCACLDRVPLFGELPLPFLRAVARRLEPRVVPSGSTVTEKGTACSVAWFVDSGMAEAFEYGLKAEPTDTVEPGGGIGVAALHEEGAQNVHVVAKTPLALYGLRRADLDAVCAPFRDDVSSAVQARLEREATMDGVRELFDEIDEDGGMSLDKEELRLLLGRLGVEVTDEKVDAMMAEMDTDGEGGDGSVQRQEFLAWLRGKAGGEYLERMAHMKAEMDYIQELFDEFDDDGSGEIGEAELTQLIRMLGVNMNKNEISQTMIELDNDSSGEVDFQEFYKWWHDPVTEGRLAACKERMATVKDVFDEVDADGGGALDRGEIRVLCEKLLGVELSEPELDAGMAEMDGDGGGEVDFSEFYRWWDQAQGGLLGEAKVRAKGNARMASVKEHFDEMDTDESGALDRAEVRALVEKLLDVEITEEQLDEGMAQMDEDGGGEVDFAEFFAWWDGAEGGLLGEAKRRAEHERQRLKRSQSKQKVRKKKATKKKTKLDPEEERARKQKKKALSLLDVAILRGVVDGDVSAVRVSLDAGSNPDSKNIAGMPILCNAASKGHAGVVALLLERHADAEIREPQRGSSALAIAAEFGHAAVIDALVAHGADVTGKDSGGATALHVAAANGQPQAIERLVAHYAPLDVLTDKGLTALFYAGQMGRTDCCRVLLEAGADADITTPWGTACERAKAKGHAATAAIIRYMPAALYAQKRTTRPDFRPVTPAQSSAMSDFVKAVGVGDVDVAARLLDQRANVNEYYQAYPAISIAAGAGNAAVVALLVERGVNANAWAPDGSTALHTAASGGYTGVVEVLVSSRAPIDMLTKQGISPLYMAAWNGHTGCVKALLDSKANYQLRTKWGTALSMAQDEGHADTAALLRNHAADAAAAEDKKREREAAAAVAAKEGPTLPPCDGVLEVVVEKCSNLIAGDRNGMSDPFVTLTLASSEPEVEQKTQTIKKTLNPVFEEALKLPISISAPDFDPDGLSLVLTVLDKDITTSDFLGEVTLNLCDAFDASGGWVASTIDGEYPFEDPDERLSGSERKQAQERSAAGIMRPYGTVTLRIEFVPDAAQMQERADAEAAAAAAAAELKAKAEREAAEMVAAKAAAAVAVDQAAKRASADAQAARLAHLTEQSAVDSVVPNDNRAQNRSGVLLSSPQRDKGQPAGIRASPDIHRSSGQIRARKSTVRRLPSMSMSGLAEVALGHKFATKTELKAVSVEKERAARRAAKIEEQKVRLAAEKERQRAERAADIPDYNNASSSFVAPVEYMLEYRQQADGSGRSGQNEEEESHPAGEKEKEWVTLVVSLNAPCSIEELRRSEQLPLLQQECAEHARQQASRGSNNNGGDQNDGMRVDDDSTSSIEVRVVGYADPWFETDQVRWAKALVRLETEAERAEAVCRHREAFLKQTQNVYLEDVQQMSLGPVQTASECWDALSLSEEAELADAAAAADQSELFDARQGRKELQLRVASRALQVYRDGQLVEDFLYVDLAGWRAEDATLLVEHSQEQQQQQQATQKAVSKYATDRSEDIARAVAARVAALQKVRWKELPAGILYFRLQAKGIRLRKDWTVQSSMLVELREQVQALDADIARGGVRESDRESQGKLLLRERRLEARRLHETIVACLQVTKRSF